MKETEQALMTAPQVARHCGADLKTIHNWVNAGQIRSFRTPGRHLRFKPEDVVEFLEQYGYPIPKELKRYTRRVIMVVDPDASTAEELDLHFGFQHQIRSFRCPVQALLAFGRLRPDLVVCEVELPGIDGYHFVERLTAGEKTSPVVVFTKQPAESRTCEDIGITAIVSKPNIKELRRHVGELLSEHRDFAEYT